MKKLLFLSFAFLGFLAHTQVKISNNDKQVIQELLQAKKGNKALNNNPIIHLNQSDYLSCIGRTNAHFDREKLTQKGIICSKAIGDIVTLKIPLSSLNKVNQLDGIAYLEIAKKMNPLLDKAVKDMHADSVQQGIGLPEAYTGKDVYIGITDWGFDYTSPMFYDTSLTQTRIRAAWDQYKTSGPHPTGYTYGTEYNSPTELLAAQCDTANVYSYATHGSHVAGICGGSGAGTIYRGVAFDAKYLFVTILVDEASVLDAWQWLYDKANADGKRLVVNMSWGLYYFGTLDGTSTLSQAITHFTDLGVVFANSGGNNGDVNFHLKKTFSNDVLKSKIDFYSYSANANMWGQSIHAWGEPGHSFANGIIVNNSSGSLLVESPYYSTNTTLNYVDTFLVTGVDTIFYNISADSAHPLNNRPQMRLRVKCTNTTLKVLLKSMADTGTVHYWNVTELSNGVGNWGMPFSFSGTGTVSGDNQYGISEPSCSDDVISVAAYTSHYTTAGGSSVGGAIASFSSIGPRYDGTMKPDITAPGVGVASSMSSFTDQAFTSIASVNFNGRTYKFAKLSGTSMASPMVAGVCALILDANPYLSARQIKSIIKQTASQDNFTGVIPTSGSTQWGAGKINAYAAVQLALVTMGTIELKTTDFILYPNPTTDVLHLKGEFAPKQVDCISLDGKTTSCPVENQSITVSNLKSGTYLVRFVWEGRVYQQKFSKL